MNQELKIKVYECKLVKHKELSKSYKFHILVYYKTSGNSIGKKHETVLIPKSHCEWNPKSNSLFITEFIKNKIEEDLVYKLSVKSIKIVSDGSFKELNKV